MLGYEFAKTGDKFRRIEVKVDHPDVTVRARNSWRPPKELRPDASRPQRAEHSLAGVVPAGDIPLRVTMAPFASPGRPGSTIAIAVGITEAVPPKKVTERINLVIGAFTPEGSPRGTQRQEATVTLLPGAGPAADIDVLSRMEIKPGRYSLRIGVFSALSNKSGSVFADVDVPDFSQDPISLSGLVVTSSAAPFTAPRDHLAKLLPVVPTTRREFRTGDTASAFLRVCQGRKTAMSPVTITATITDTADVVVVRRTQSLETGRFANGREADYRLEIPLARLRAGEYLLTVSASAGETSARRDARFTVK